MGLNTSSSGLTPNTTYFFRARALWNNANSNLLQNASGYAAVNSTPTLANLPATAVSTFTSVTASSIAVQWIQNSNPPNVTLYTMRTSTSPDFIGVLDSSSTYSLFASTLNLPENTTRYFQVKATNYGGLSTSFVFLGSTQTLGIPPAAVTSLSALTGTYPGELNLSWIAPGE